MLSRWRQYASLPLRLVLGALFLMHGSQKLFGVFGGPGLSGTAASMASLGVTPGLFWAWVAGLVELIGGAARPAEPRPWRRGNPLSCRRERVVTAVSASAAGLWNCCVLYVKKRSDPANQWETCEVSPRTLSAG
jgi:hypothetical protein